MCYEPDLWHTLYRDALSITILLMGYKHLTRKGNRSLDECQDEDDNILIQDRHTRMILIIFALK